MVLPGMPIPPGAIMPQGGRGLPLPPLPGMPFPPPGGLPPNFQFPLPNGLPPLPVAFPGGVPPPNFPPIPLPAQQTPQTAIPGGVSGSTPGGDKT